MRAKNVAVTGILLGLALALSLAERLLPLGAAIGVPGVKLGLSNIVVMFTLYFMGASYAFAVVALKSLIMAAFSGATAFFFSAAGGLLALLAMCALKHFSRAFSLLGVSVGGAATHNVGQCLVAAAAMGDAVLFGYMPLLIAVGVACGVVTGLLSQKLFGAAAKTRLFKGKGGFGE